MSTGPDFQECEFNHAFGLAACYLEEYLAFASSIFLYGYAKTGEESVTKVLQSYDIASGWKINYKSYVVAVAQHCLSIEDPKVCERYASLVLKLRRRTLTPLKAVTVHVPLLARAYELDMQVVIRCAREAKLSFAIFKNRSNTNSEALYTTWREVVAKLKKERLKLDS